MQLESSNQQKFVISLGGSLIAGESLPNWEFLKQFRDIIQAELKKGSAFYIIVGGGHPARMYQQALKAMGHSNQDLDYVGIYATHFNAHYVSLAFGFPADHKVVLKVDNLNPDTNLHVSGAGLRPGQSSDTVAIQTAMKVGAGTVINLSNITQVYTDDPNVNDQAQPLSTLSWSDYLDIIPNEWQPGLSTPFDPVASKLANENNLKVVILGKDLDNFKSYLHHQSFIGTTIS